VPVVTFQDVFDAEAKLLLDDVGLPTDFTLGVDFGKAREILVA
jgi:hypothetical protein